MVWYEKDQRNIGLRDNEQVFAARIVEDPKADGGFSWRAVGNGTAGQNNMLDTTGRERLRRCAVSTTAEDACSLNKVAGNDARGPARRGGHADAGRPDGALGRVVRGRRRGQHAIFISRLVGGDHFELFNGGNPVSPGRSGRRPARHHVLREHAVRLVDGKHGDETRGFVGHFDAAGAFILDTPGGIRLGDGRGTDGGPL